MKIKCTLAPKIALDPGWNFFTHTGPLGHLRGLHKNDPRNSSPFQFGYWLERMISNCGFIKVVSFTKATGRSQCNPLNEVPMIILPKFERGDFYLVKFSFIVFPIM